MINVKNQNSDAQFWMYKLLLPKLQEPGKQSQDWASALGYKSSRKTSNCFSTLAGNADPPEHKDRSEQLTLRTPTSPEAQMYTPQAGAPTHLANCWYWSSVPLQLLGRNPHSSHWRCWTCGHTPAADPWVCSLWSFPLLHHRPTGPPLCSLAPAAVLRHPCSPKQEWI